jgi:hypothetical protein
MPINSLFPNAALSSQFLISFVAILLSANLQPSLHANIALKLRPWPPEASQEAYIQSDVSQIPAI